MPAAWAATRWNMFKETVMKSRAGAVRRGVRAAALAGLVLSGAACSNAGEGALSGAALGAGTGAIVGSMFADAGRGAIIGGALGAMGGAILGDQNQRHYRHDDRYYYYDRYDR